MKQPYYIKKKRLQVDKILLDALKEDIGTGDITSNTIIDQNQTATAQIITKGKGVLAGGVFVKRLFKLLDSSIKVRLIKHDGDIIKKGDTIAIIRGNARKILSGERTALNILCRLSGIATLTRKFVDRVSDTKAIILDTRKTTPNFRLFEKYAVMIGGGQNHRMGLYDMILIKDNHIKLAGSIANAVKKLLSKYRKNNILYEVEVKNLRELKEALYCGVPLIMLDNFSLKDIRMAVKLSHGKAQLEASGGINLNNVRKIAKTGVDFISVGMLTHSAPIIDISMKIT
ncbi:MAG: carboxylating nicotinate-nucleotide diphosphorylase [candidate division WOR-3 bacterium]